MERGPRQAVDPMSRFGIKRVSFKESQALPQKRPWRTLDPGEDDEQSGLIIQNTVHCYRDACD
jgi:hypothetical protein